MNWSTVLILVLFARPPFSAPPSAGLDFSWGFKNRGGWGSRRNSALLVGKHTVLVLFFPLLAGNTRRCVLVFSPQAPRPRSCVVSVLFSQAPSVGGLVTPTRWLGARWLGFGI